MLKYSTAGPLPFLSTQHLSLRRQKCQTRSQGPEANQPDTSSLEFAGAGDQQQDNSRVAARSFWSYGEGCVPCLPCSGGSGCAPGQSRT